MDVDEMNNRIKIEEIKCEIDDIGARTLIQQRDLPNLRREHRSRQEEYQRAMSVLNGGKKIQDAFRTMKNAGWAKANVIQSNQQHVELVGKALVKEREICNDVNNKERIQIEKIVYDHEQRTSELSDILHNVPILYSDNELQTKQDKIRSTVDRLRNGIAVNDGEIAALRSHFARPDSKPMKGNLYTQKDSRSVELILQDNNTMDKMLQKLSAGDQIIEKQSRQLQQEITNALVSRDALFKNRQNNMYDGQ